MAGPAVEVVARQMKFLHGQSKADSLLGSSRRHLVSTIVYMFTLGDVTTSIGWMDGWMDGPLQSSLRQGKHSPV